MQMRGVRASTVIVHHVPPEQTDSFLASEKEITSIARTFPGYQATEIYPPSPPSTQEWVVIVHFEDQATLQNWIDSPVRKECIDKLSKEVGKYELKMLPSGFGAWFAGLAISSENGPPPGWKMAATVLLALYPIVMLLALTVGRLTSPLGLAISMLIGNALSISILQWGVMPIVTKLLKPWLTANKPQDRTRSIVGLMGVLVSITIITMMFYLISG
jgi:antibiotic biosynthesis monooxygenase (ABM) superfamily enzyme